MPNLLLTVATAAVQASFLNPLSALRPFRTWSRRTSTRHSSCSRVQFARFDMMNGFNSSNTHTMRSEALADLRYCVFRPKYTGQTCIFNIV